MSRTSRNPKTVAIIGAGVGGLAAAKHLMAERVNKRTGEKYFNVTIFERQSSVGGVWILNAPDDDFPTPMYAGLETNVPRDFMTYTTLPYPPSTPLFPPHETIQAYLKQYARSIQNCIEFNSEIIRISNVTKNYQRKWKIEVRNRLLGSDRIWYFDAVVVATGTFNKSFVPPELKFDAWEKAYPGSVIHSRDFRDPEVFRNQKVLIVGGGPSYFDIARRIFDVTKGPLLVSTRAKIALSSQNQRPMPGVKELLPEGKAVRFVDGQIENGIDKILLCTGYYYEFPFIPSVRVEEGGQRVVGLWEHVFWITRPTLAFVGLPKMSATFPLIETQCAYIARVFSGRLYVPSEPSMREEAKKELDKWMLEVGNGLANTRGFHNFRNPRDKDYVMDLEARCLEAEQYPEESTGMSPPTWTPRMEWIRSILGQLRTAFFAKGIFRNNFPTPESLGFNYTSPKDGSIDVGSVDKQFTEDV